AREIHVCAGGAHPVRKQTALENCRRDRIKMPHPRPTWHGTDDGCGHLMRTARGPDLIPAGPSVVLPRQSSHTLQLLRSVLARAEVAQRLMWAPVVVPSRPAQRLDPGVAHGRERGPAGVDEGVARHPSLDLDASGTDAALWEGATHPHQRARRTRAV